MKPAYPDYEHSFGPGNALDTADLLNPVPGNGGAEIKSSRVMGHYPDVYARMSNNCAIRVDPANQKTDLCGRQKKTQRYPHDGNHKPDSFMDQHLCGDSESGGIDLHFSEFRFDYSANQWVS